MKRLLAALAFLLLCGPVLAACPSPYVLKDGNANNQNAEFVNNANANCEPVVVLGDGGGVVANKQSVNGNQAAKVFIDQGAPGTTNGVVSGANFYQAVAASQTATVLQSSVGATGDYLSHCVIYPTSTSPGAVTVFDNTNTAANSAILFAGGASSTSNLTPITVPVGAKSVNGAWKVTTGSAVSVVCVGKFS